MGLRFCENRSDRYLAIIGATVSPTKRQLDSIPPPPLYEFYSPTTLNHPLSRSRLIYPPDSSLYSLFFLGSVAVMYRLANRFLPGPSFLFPLFRSLVGPRALASCNNWTTKGMSSPSSCAHPNTRRNRQYLAK